MKKNTLTGLAIGLFMFGFCSLGNASLIETSPTTFKDTDTGYEWLKLGQFFGMNYHEMVAALPLGFSSATEIELKTLTDAAPAYPTKFEIHASIMGVPVPTAYNRETIWGYYGDGTKRLSKFSNHTRWGTNVSNTSGWGNLNYVVNPDEGYADLGIFAVKTSLVPLPTTILLFGMGLTGIIATTSQNKSGSGQNSTKNVQI